MGFPEERPRRLRQSAGLRRLAAETVLTPGDFIYPLFVVPGRDVARPIGSLPGQCHWSPERVVEPARAAFEAGVPAVLLFGQPPAGAKDAQGSGAWDDAGAVQEAVRRLKDALPELVVMTDVCLCAYTDHGHCGPLAGGRVDNDAALPLLARVALSHARAGADVVAPSDMMDGRVAAIRRALDTDGRGGVAILAYAAKYASGFYGPFREAEDSSPLAGDRRGYQMDPPNLREALREIALDVDEGADMVMVKPALAYLDVIRAARARVEVPLLAYSVSGEYAMVEAAAARGWIDGRAVALEVLLAIKRAGADAVITYWAPEAARALRRG